jgi:hypothetical protein
MFENIVEMALIAMAEVRAKWSFKAQSVVEIGAVLVHAMDLRVSQATMSFYPVGDAGEPIVGEDEVWIPNIPIPVPPEMLRERAKALADEMAADLLTRLR